ILRKSGNEAVLEQARRMEQELADTGIRVFLDDREQHRPGWKFNEYEVQGVPIRLALGPRDLENGVVELARRDTGEKQSVALDDLTTTIRETLDAIQQGLFDRALAFRQEQTRIADDYATFKSLIEEGGFVLMHWDGTAETETQIKEETKATIRCIPFGGQFDGTDEPGTDPVSGQPSEGRVVFARAY
ncbi:MAG: proline--tRNA ligase, partial [Rhodothermaceae bacterium]|nr:proline--tRNA ligase [Rhodothermaceae bacterium]